MSAGRLPAPGTKLGPCETWAGAECTHIDCASTRADAASLCVTCGQTIGYERGFYVVSNDKFSTGLEHSDCAEDRVERERAARR